jgi:uncharacterized repeat protein (TIGR03803 family)
MKCLAIAVALGVALCADRADSQTFTTLVQFTGTGGTASGKWPVGSLIASGGTLYGLTNEGGANGFGTVFSVGTNGTNYRDLVDYTGGGGTASGAHPTGSLLASGGALYGMTDVGGANGKGVVFSVGANGTNYRDLVDFTGSGGRAIARI